MIGDCLETLRIVALLASPVIPNAAGRAVAAARPARSPRGPTRARPRRRGGSCPRARSSRRASRCSREKRRNDGVGRRALSSATRAGGDAIRGARRRRAGRAGARRGRRVDGVRRHRSRDLPAGARARGRVTTTCTRPWGCIRTTRRSSTTEWAGLVELAGADALRRDRRGRVRSLLRALAARRAGSRVPAPDPSSPRRVDRPLMIHSRNAWDDTFRVLDDEGAPGAHDLPLLHRRSRRSARRARPRLLPVVQRDRLVQDGRRRARRGRARARRSGARRDRQPVPRAGSASRPGRTSRPTCRSSAPRWPRPARSTPEEIADADPRERGAGVRRRAVTPTQIHALLDAHRLRPSKALGQNFLADNNMAEHIVRLAGVQPGDHVVEVGPGLGSLTLALVDAGAHVRAVELDRRLAPVLSEVVAGRAGRRRGRRRARSRLARAARRPRPVDMVSNLPYNVATPVVRACARDRADDRPLPRDGAARGRGAVGRGARHEGLRCGLGEGRVLRPRRRGRDRAARGVRAEAEGRQRARAAAAPRGAAGRGRGSRADVRARSRRLRDPAQDVAARARPRARRSARFRCCATPASIPRPAPRRSRCRSGRRSRRSSRRAPRRRFASTRSPSSRSRCTSPGTRPDGYHELDALMVSVSEPHDELVLRPRDHDGHRGHRTVRGRSARRRDEPRACAPRTRSARPSTSSCTRASRPAPGSAADRPTRPRCSSARPTSPASASPRTCDVGRIAATLGADVPFCLRGKGAHARARRRRGPGSRRPCPTSRS